MTSKRIHDTRRVQLAVVHGGMMEWATVDSLITALAEDSAERATLGFVQAQSIYVPAARQQIARTFLDSALWAEWLFFVDSDIVFSLDNVYALLDSAHPETRPVVMGTVFLNGPHGVRVAGWQEGETEIGWQQGGMIEAHVVGTGFTVYHRAALEMVQSKHGTMFAEAWEGDRFYGEDVAFSYRARDCGLSLYLNADVRVGHLKKVMLDEGWARASLLWHEGKTNESVG